MGAAGLGPGQGEADERHDGGHHESGDGNEGGGQEAEAERGDGDRGKQQEKEGIRQAAGDGDQRGELDRVEAELGRGLPAAREAL